VATVDVVRGQAPDRVQGIAADSWSGARVVE